jgi:hypothetical protein
MTLIIDEPMWQVARRAVQSPVDVLRWVFFGEYLGGAMVYFGVFLMSLVLLMAML